MATITILVIYDGKPGHLSQSQGLAELICRGLGGRCEIVLMRAKPRIKLLNRPLRALVALGRRALCRSILPFYCISPRPPRRPDLIISFGGNVVALNLALSRLWQARNIAIGNIYNFSPADFDVHVTAFGNPNQANAVATNIALCRTDREQCQRAGVALRTQYSATPLWTLLVGGDGSGYRYTPQDWLALGDALQILAKKHNIRWLVSTSRRTDSEGIKILRERCDSDCVVSAIWYGEADSPSLNTYLGAASRIFCTEDSLSMLSESVAMDKPVVSLSPLHSEDYSTHHAMVAHMQRSGLLQRLKVAELAAYQPAPFLPSQPYDLQLSAILEQIIATGVLRSVVSPMPSTRPAGAVGLAG